MWQTIGKIAGRIRRSWERHAPIISSTPAEEDTMQEAHRLLGELIQERRYGVSPWVKEEVFDILPDPLSPPVLAALEQLGEPVPQIPNTLAEQRDLRIELAGRLKELGQQRRDTYLLPIIQPEARKGDNEIALSELAEYWTIEEFWCGSIGREPYYPPVFFGQEFSDKFFRELNARNHLAVYRLKGAPQRREDAYLRDQVENMRMRLVPGLREFMQQLETSLPSITKTCPRMYWEPLDPSKVLEIEQETIQEIVQIARDVLRNFKLSNADIDVAELDKTLKEVYRDTALAKLEPHVAKLRQRGLLKPKPRSRLSRTASRSRFQ